MGDLGEESVEKKKKGVEKERGRKREMGGSHVLVVSMEF
jgi:hypothetical protein